MFNNASRRTAARVALALMLFAQGALAWSACELPERAPELALRAVVAHQGCEQMAEPASAASSVCFMHSLANKQALYKPALDLPALQNEPVLIVALDHVWLLVKDTPPVLPPRSTGPPRRILLQSFQI